MGYGYVLGERAPVYAADGELYTGMGFGCGKAPRTDRRDTSGVGRFRLGGITGPVGRLFVIHAITPPSRGCVRVPPKGINRT